MGGLIATVDIEESRMRLFIAEKPDLAKAIVAGLGGGFSRADGYFQKGNDTVTWCFGHLLQLLEPEDYDLEYKKWALTSLPMCLRPWQTKPLADKKKQLKIILALIKKADIVIHAGDPDEEGQLLVDEILTYAKCKKPVKRLLINDNNTAIVKKAIVNMKPNEAFYGLSQRALARSVADQIYGLNLTRLYSLSAQQSGYQGVLSVGRVQTPILGLVVRRDRANASHQSHFYYVLDARFSEKDQTIRCKFKHPEDAPVDDEGRVTDPEYLQAIAQRVDGRVGRKVDFKKEVKKTPPPLPYNLIKLQMDASKRFGLDPDKVLKITQSLREKHKLISYNRSDCQYLSNEQHADGPGVLSAIGKTLPSFASKIKTANPSIKSRAFNSKNVSAHHAIIPTMTSANLSDLSQSEANIYELIARQYVAQFYPPYQYLEVSISFLVEGHLFAARAQKPLEQGWKALFQYKESEEDNPNPTLSAAAILAFEGIESALCSDLKIDKKETQPPKLYTMATLLQDLTRVAKYVKDPKLRQILQDRDKDKKGEHGGIGTPATRSAIIENLFKRDFLTKKGKNIISTAVGQSFHDLLPESATWPDMTARWHEHQVMIEDGSLKLESFIRDVERVVNLECQQVKRTGLDLKGTSLKGLALPGQNHESQGISCPSCRSGVLGRRKGKKGFFWGCSAYSAGCQAIFRDKRGKPELKPKAKRPANITTYQCKDCGKPLVKREVKKTKGKAKRFWFGCSGFPECKTMYYEHNGEPAYEKTT